RGARSSSTSSNGRSCASAISSSAPARWVAEPLAGLLPDLAALGLAFLFGHLDPALALARVLTGAGVVGAVAGALAFARVDALTLDLVRVCGRHDQRRRSTEKASRHGGDESALRCHLHRPFGVRSVATVRCGGSSPKRDRCLLPEPRIVVSLFRRKLPRGKFQGGVMTDSKTNAPQPPGEPH